MLLEHDKELSNRDPHRKPNLILNSHFMERLLFTNKEYAFGNVVRWTKKYDIFTMHKIFFPINIDNTHWATAVIDMQLKRIHYYCSLHQDGTLYLRSLMKWLNDVAKDKKKPAIKAAEWTCHNNTDSMPRQLTVVSLPL